MAERVQYNIQAALENGLVSLEGNFAVVIKIGHSENPNLLMALKLAYPNECGYFFTTRDIARDYIKNPPDTEVDLKRSGGILMIRSHL